MKLAMSLDNLRRSRRGPRPNDLGRKQYQNYCLPSFPLDMRYQGQGYSLEVHFTLRELSRWKSFQEIEKRFHHLHQATFGYSDTSSLTEIVNVRLVGIGALPRPTSSPKERRIPPQP